MSADRCYQCGQFVGPEGQYGAIAPSDATGDPDYDRAIDVCSEKCARAAMARTGYDHWFTSEAVGA